ncbi:hypothetical protein RI054_38g142350 [Pseudoscourfieldia marina]
MSSPRSRSQSRSGSGRYAYVGATTPTPYPYGQPAAGYGERFPVAYGQSPVAYGVNPSPVSTNDTAPPGQQNVDEDDYDTESDGAYDANDAYGVPTGVGAEAVQLANLQEGGMPIEPARMESFYYDTDPVMRERLLGETFWQNNPRGVYVPALMNPQKGQRDPVNEFIKSLDVNEDGYVNGEEFKAGVQFFLKERRRQHQLKGYVVIVAVISAMFMAAVAGITFAVVDLTKDMKSSDDGTLQTRDGDTAKLANSEMEVVSSDLDTSTKPKRRKINEVSDNFVKEGNGCCESPMTMTTAPPGEEKNKTTQKEAVRTAPLRTAVAIKRGLAGAESLLNLKPEEISDMTSINAVTSEGQQKIAVEGSTAEMSVTRVRDAVTKVVTERVAKTVVFKTNRKDITHANVTVVTQKVGDNAPVVVSAQTATVGPDKVKKYINGEIEDAVNSLPDSGSARRRLHDATLQDVIVEACAFVGNFLGLGDELANAARKFMDDIKALFGVLDKELDIFIDWFPIDLKWLKEGIEKAIRDIWKGASSAIQSQITAIGGALSQWVKVDGRGMVCFDASAVPGANAAGELSTSLPTSSEGSSGSVMLKLPQSVNCGGVIWDDVGLHQDRIDAFFNRMIFNNPISQIVTDVLHEVMSSIPSGITDFFNQWRNVLLDAFQTLVGVEGRNQIERLMNTLSPTDVGRRRRLQEIVREAKLQLPNDGKKMRVHLKDLLLHPNATGELRDVVEKAMHKVAMRRFNASTEQLYRVQHAVKKAQEGDYANEAEAIAAASLPADRRKLAEFNVLDIGNMFWFSSIPFKYESAMEFTASYTFDGQISEKGDLLKDIGVPTFDLSRELSLLGMIELDVDLKLDIKAPYEIMVIANDAALEVKVVVDAEMLVDLATGEISAKVSTARGGLTGIRVTQGSITGHAHFKVDVEAVAGIGVCLASFCIKGKAEYSHEVATVGFDVATGRGGSTPEDTVAARIIQSTNDFSWMQPRTEHIRYSDAQIQGATACKTNAGDGGYMIGGAYVVSPWPSVRVTMETPLDGSGGGAEANVVLLAWNWDKYEPSFVYTQMTSGGSFLASPKRVTLAAMASTLGTAIPAIAIGVLSKETNPLFEPIIPTIENAVMSTASGYASVLSGSIQNAVSSGLLPNVLFGFDFGLNCGGFPTNALQVTIPFYVKPWLGAILDGSRSRRRAMSEDPVFIQSLKDAANYREVEGTCVHNGELCSEDMHCCSLEAVCSHVSWSTFRVCTHPTNEHYKQALGGRAKKEAEKHRAKRERRH